MTRTKGAKSQSTITRLKHFEEIANNPEKIWKNEHNIVSVPKTLVKNGYRPHSALCGILGKMLRDKQYVTGFWKATFKDGQTINGMRLGDKTVAMSNADKDKPAVYAVVCEGSGKMYIGSSRKPLLRRSVHLYWLKNPDEEGTSNIIKGNLEIQADLKKYGWESFYFEILEVVESGLRADLQAIEREMMELHRDKLYNLYRADMKMRRYHMRKDNPRFFKYDERLREIREQIHNLVYSLKGLSRGHPERKRGLKKLAQLTRKRDELRAKKRMTGRYTWEKHDVLTGKRLGAH